MICSLSKSSSTHGWQGIYFLSIWWIGKGPADGLMPLTNAVPKLDINSVGWNSNIFTWCVFSKSPWILYGIESPSFPPWSICKKKVLPEKIFPKSATLQKNKFSLITLNLTISNQGTIIILPPYPLNRSSFLTHSLLFISHTSPFCC